ncbi:type II toxin-antitoxin system RelE/ParE family toxin [Macrococcus sp. DPC7161]|uniref:type II toxin-antitoxin system RelE family toxin n=1 Tax=Macrococcus sp. DPC7161 TaxID=2507060 RepID=UPI00100B5E39|nr:addiction module toxin RelE [Macrococcus sp. DPC7161]RXK17478.1 addiction module toxin RelE [Macrococcus sp. DPC7161]
MFKLRFTQYSKNDFLSLDGSQKKVVLKGLKKIEMHGMNIGEPLSGKLSHCRKIKFKKMGLRIIFRQVEHQIEIIEIVAIGKRDNLSVYLDATSRID